MSIKHKPYYLPEKFKDQIQDLTHYFPEEITSPYTNYFSARTIVRPVQISTIENRSEFPRSVYHTGKKKIAKVGPADIGMESN